MGLWLVGVLTKRLGAKGEPLAGGATLQEGWLVGWAVALRPASEIQVPPMLVDAHPVRLRTRVRFPPPPCRTFPIEMTTVQRVIGPASPKEFGEKAGGAEWPPSLLLHWNESVGDFLRGVAAGDRRRALRQMEAEVLSWRRQQSDAQIAWARQQHTAPHRGPLGAADAIVDHLS